MNSPKKTNKTTSLNKVKKFLSDYKHISIGLLVVVFVLGSGIILFKKDGSRNAQILQHPEPLSVDLPGWWFKEYFGSSVCESEECKTEKDPDNDGINNGQEFYYNTNPVLADTNGNGKNDGDDVASGIEPSKKTEMTFEEAASDDNIFGESLLFGETLREEFVNSIDPKKVAIPEVNEAELRIIENPSNEDLVNYASNMGRTISKYFTVDQDTFIQDVIQSGDPGRLADVQMRCAKVIGDLKEISVPKDYVKFHKYNIAMFKALQVVVVVPDDAALENDFDPVANRWYDNAQALMLLNQLMSNENERLQAQISN